MTNEKLLRKKIAECGYTLEAFASELGITRQCLNNKLKNKREFKQSEIQKSIDILHLGKEQSDAIFFALYVG